MTGPTQDDRLAFMALGGDLDAADLLDEVHAQLLRYVVFPTPSAADAAALWVMATHIQPALECAPRLALTSPEKRCGKSTLLTMLAALCARPIPTSNISTAALVHSITPDNPPTILLDEADTKLRGSAADLHEDLRGILNSGHSRGWPYRRWDPATRRLEIIDPFAMAALASIGDLPDTIMDRAIVIRMRRAAPGDAVIKLRRRHLPFLRELGGAVAEWGKAACEALQDAEPAMPSGVDGRAADTWEPLLAVADHAGGTWPGRARSAAVRLTTAEVSGEVSLGIRLLADIRELFTDFTVSFMGSADLVARLHKLDESPWNEADLTVRRLALMLREYGIAPGHNDARTARGYRRDSFEDAFARYLLGPPSVQPVQASQDEPI